MTFGKVYINRDWWENYCGVFNSTVFLCPKTLLTICFNKLTVPFVSSQVIGVLLQGSEVGIIRCRFKANVSYQHREVDAGVSVYTCNCGWGRNNGDHSVVSFCSLTK